MTLWYLTVHRFLVWSCIPATAVLCIWFVEHVSYHRHLSKKGLTKRVWWMPLWRALLWVVTPLLTHTDAWHDDCFLSFFVPLYLCTFIPLYLWTRAMVEVYVYIIKKIPGNALFSETPHLSSSVPFETPSKPKTGFEKKYSATWWYTPMA